MELDKGGASSRLKRQNEIIKIELKLKHGYKKSLVINKEGKKKNMQAQITCNERTKQTRGKTHIHQPEQMESLTSLS